MNAKRDSAGFLVRSEAHTGVSDSLLSRGYQRYVSCGGSVVFAKRVGEGEYRIKLRHDGTIASRTKKTVWGPGEYRGW